MTSKPLRVTIGLPVFNGEKFLRGALDSLLAQEFTDFELIVSDNASTDGTEAICMEYTARDARVRYIRQNKNAGGIFNFNFVLREARSEYFMWAAVDDQWTPDFLQCLWTVLENDPTAIGAFCPYQLVEEETGVVLDGIWKCDYENDQALVRLLKFTHQYRDACIYGLFRREYLNDVQFKPWGWINAVTPYNLVYPELYLLLAKGNFLLAGEKPLWFKSVTTTHWHSTPFRGNPAFAYFAHILRKMNLFARSISHIYLGSKSAPLAIAMIPFLLLRFFYDSLTPIYAAISIWLSGRKISQVSPHEIWRLGVR